MSDWLNELIDSTSEAESPTSFMYWSGLCAVSAVINRQAWLERGGVYELYPNIYVLLIAKSGMRKGFPVSVSKQLVQAVGNTRVFTGRISFQALLQQLSIAKPTPNYGLLKDSIAYINSGEFSTSLVRDPDALTILTDLFDGHYHKGGWSTTLKGSGKEELKNICITLLGAMNQTHFNDMITAKEITGGFIGRCILVLEHRRSRRNPLVDEAAKRFDVEESAKFLKHVATLKGKFLFHPDAKSIFRDWYKDFEPEATEDKTGSAQRLHDNILKLAMLLAIARSGKLAIMPEHMQEAMKVMIESSTSVEQITQGSGVDEAYSKKLRLFFMDLYSAPEFTLERQAWLSKRYGDFDKWDLDRIIEHTVEAGGVEVLREDDKVMYRLTQKAIDSMKGGRFGGAKKSA